ncbi:MAG: hypothetical protein QOE94_775 [Mycobacterium sp.]|nr:hypothetical protein [Mycobacterium sp.]
MALPVGIHFTRLHHGTAGDQYSNRYNNPQRLRPSRWTSQMVNATEATTAITIMSRIWVVIALIYR